MLLKEMGDLKAAEPLLDDGSGRRPAAGLAKPPQAALLRALARDLNGLGLLRQEQGRLEDGAGCARTGPPPSAASPAGESTRCAPRWINNLGSLLRDLGRLDEAVDRHRRALALDEAQRGARTTRPPRGMPTTWPWRCSPPGEANEALALAERALADRRSRLWPGAPQHRPRPGQPGRDPARAGRFPAALQSTRRALEIFAARILASATRWSARCGTTSATPTSKWATWTKP